MTLRDIDVNARRVLVRVDFNVPQDEKGAITDDSRIRAALPTINYLIEQKARVVLMSHLGRPKGVVEKLRLAPIARRLSQLLGLPVEVAPDCTGPDVEKAVAALKPGQVLILENLRFHPEEEAGDASFAQALARLGDVFVNDAFGACHRAHASVSVIARYLPAVAGFLMQKEIDTLGGVLERPAHPFVALLGGAKVSDKVSMLENIMGKIDKLLIGGGMAATFLKARSYEVGLSLVEADKIDTASRLMEQAGKGGVRLVLPTDVLVAGEIKADASMDTVPVERIPIDRRIVDIGPETVKQFREELQGSRTVFWNGPMGIHEIEQFAAGTREMAEALSRLDASTIIGGGSTAEAVYGMGFADKMTFISTGGGASLEFLSGDKLPGVECLLDKKG